ncbi:hypothetical protein HCH52_02050 [Oscillospiraceae bacterium HV4-5-C5C]|nr:hypothetical protein [Oscillospiraceae bacterium HV4-5-C5C]
MKSSVWVIRLRLALLLVLAVLAWRLGLFKVTTWQAFSSSFFAAAGSRQAGLRLLSGAIITVLTAAVAAVVSRLLSGPLTALGWKNLSQQKCDSLGSALLQLYLSAFNAIPGLLQALIWSRLLGLGGQAGRLWTALGPPLLLLAGLSLQLTAAFTVDRLGPDWQRLGRQTEKPATGAPGSTDDRQLPRPHPLTLVSALPRALTASAAFGFVLQTDLSWQAGQLADQTDSLWPLILAAAFYWLLFSLGRWLCCKFPSNG